MVFKVNVNRRAKKTVVVKRSDLCIKTCSVNAAEESMSRFEGEGRLTFFIKDYKGT